MMRFTLLSVALLSVLVQAAAAAPVVVNSGFEDPALTTTDWAYTNPFAHDHGLAELTDIPGWTFGPSGGDSYDGIIRCGRTEFPAGATDNMQWAFLEGSGAITQTVGGFATGTATISFQGFGRNTPGAGGNGIQVLVDGAAVTIAGSSSVTPADGVVTSYTTDSFNVSAGSHTVTFLGTIPISSGDHTVFVDNIGVANTAVPEPSTLIVLSTGVLGLLAYAWRKNK
jgi:hypothetical protein